MITESVPIDTDLISSVLLIRLRSLGDAVLMTPLVSALKSWRSDLHLGVLIEEPFADVFLSNPKVDQVIVLRTQGGRISRLLKRASAVTDIRRRTYDLVLNLHGGTTSLLLTLASRGKAKVGYSFYRYARLYDHLVPDGRIVWQKDKLHTVQIQLAPLKWLGIPVPEAPELELFVSSQARESVRRRLQAEGLTSRPLAVVHPTATLTTKQWEISNFCRLIKYLRSKHGLSVIVTVGTNERETADKIASELGSEATIYSDLKLSELIALLDEATLFVGNDSGPMHIAAALKKRTVVIFGSSSATAWHPWGTRYELLQSDLPCIPCPGYRCYAYGDPRCIKGIRVEDVAWAVDRILSREQ